MELIPINDHENFFFNKQFRKAIKENERILWSGKILKINKYDMRQKRLFVITDGRILNLGNQDNLIRKIFDKLVKREINIYEVTGITYSLISNNFVLHIPREYDYYLCTDKRDEIISYILRIRAVLNYQPISFYFIEDIELSGYTKRDDETTMKYPNVDPVKIK